MRELLTKTCANLFAHNQTCYNLCARMYTQASIIYPYETSLKIQWNDKFTNIQQEAYDGLIGNILNYCQKECISIDGICDSPLESKYGPLTMTIIALYPIGAVIIAFNYLDAYEKSIHNTGGSTARLLGSISGLASLAIDILLLVKELNQPEPGFAKMNDVDLSCNMLIILSSSLLLYTAGKHIGFKCGKKIEEINCNDTFKLPILFNRIQPDNVIVAQSIDEEQTSLNQEYNTTDQKKPF